VVHSGIFEAFNLRIIFSISALLYKESNKTLASLQAARKKVFEENPDPILVVKTDGTIVEANPSAEEKLGQSSIKITGTNIYNIFLSTSPASKHFLDPLHSDSENISLELNSSGTDYLVSVSPLKNQEAEDTFLLVARDISEQKAHKTETIKASKLAAMGELSVGVANEINNLTNGLINYTQILSEEIEETTGKNDQSSELLNNIIKEGERISQIVQQLLFFNANHAQTKEAVKINKIVEDSLTLTKNQFRYDAIEVSVNFPDIVPSVQVNVQEMQHIFLNLLSNARYALNQKYPGVTPEKKLVITAEPKQVDNESVIDISFYDTGVGIPAQIIDKVINPFFTTKPAGEGTGLGLAISHGIVTDHDGRLIIKSVEGEYTKVTTRFPLPKSDNSSETV